MRRQSKKTATREAEAKPILDALKAEVGRCEKCGLTRQQLEAHEIARGSHRNKARGKRFATIILCPPCHDELGDTKAWPHARQLCILRQSRPDDFDLAAFNELMGRGPQRITEADIAEWSE